MKQDSVDDVDGESINFSNARLSVDDLFLMAYLYVSLKENIGAASPEAMYKALKANEMTFETHPEEFENEAFNFGLMEIYPTQEERDCIETLRQLRLCHVIEQAMYKRSESHKAVHYEKELAGALNTSDPDMRKTNRELFNAVVSKAFIDDKLHEDYNSVFPHYSSEQSWDASSGTVRAYMQDNGNVIKLAYDEALSIETFIAEDVEGIKNAAARLDAYHFLGGNRENEPDDKAQAGNKVNIWDIIADAKKAMSEEPKPSVYKTKIVGLELRKNNN